MPLGHLAIVGGPSGPSVLYGATYSDPSIVFSLTPPASPGGSWTYAVVYAFTGGPTNGIGGYLPMGGVVMGSGGVLYGTTLNGGGGTNCQQSLGCGTVFSLTPPASPGGAWTETLLYGFTGGSDGALPSAGVAIGAGGVLYGTTVGGGAFNAGAVFSLTPPSSPGGAWTETVLHSFARGSNGAAGCGTLFTLKPPASSGGSWAEKTLYSFACAPDGSEPQAGVVMGGGGVLYGTTRSGGTGNCPSGCGTVFSLTPPATPGISWTETVLHSFAGGSDGAYPMFAGVVIGSGGVLYGTTAEGGIESACCGTVFSLTPPVSPGGTWTEAVFAFGGSPNAGSGPYGGVVLGPDGVLYGTTTGGGTRNNGAVFAWKP